MKKVNVNLLPTKTRFQLAQIRLAKRLKKIAFAVVVVWLLVVAIVGLFRLALLLKSRSLASQKDSLETSLSQFSPEIDLQQALRFRLKLLAETLEARPLITDKLKTIYNLLPEGSRIDNLKIDKKEIKISGSISSLAGVAKLEEGLALAGKDQTYRSAKLAGLSYDERKGRWDFALELKEGKKNGS